MTGELPVHSFGDRGWDSQCPIDSLERRSQNRSISRSIHSTIADHSLVLQIT